MKKKKIIDQIDKISVIIPTVNAHEELDLALTSLHDNSDYQLDLIVVVDPDLNSGKINQDILKVCKKHGIKPHLNKKNLGPYGNWNKGASLASTDWLIFATDDQYFAPHWDRNLLKYWEPRRLVAGRLVEPGILPVWEGNLEKNFGTIPSEFKEEEFKAYCAQRSVEGFAEGGFFIPMLQHRDDYHALGGYPTKGKFGTSAAISNDINYVQAAQEEGYVFGTASDSYSYHFQASSWKKKTSTPKIAAIVLTNNEEKDLPSCLKSLNWCNQVIVIDSGSTDKTLDVAKRHKTKVYKHKFKDFASQRNFALSKAVDYDWVFFVDADEVVEKELSKELTSFAQDIYLDGVEVRRKNYIFGKWIKHSDWYPDYRLVFARPKLVEFVSGVHERLQFTRGNGSITQSSHHILHHNYDTVSEFVIKNLVSYPLSYAKELDKEGEKFVASDLFVKPIGEFMRRYFLSEGYKDGLYGLVLSLLMGAQSLVAYIYLWEMQGKREELTSQESRELFASLKDKAGELSYWLSTVAIEKSKGARKYLHRAHRKALKIVKGL